VAEQDRQFHLRVLPAGIVIVVPQRKVPSGLVMNRAARMCLKIQISLIIA